MKTYIDSGLLPPKAKNTAEFIQKVDHLFDLMNSISPFARPGKEAISWANLTSKLDELNWYRTWISSWEFEGDTIKKSMPFKNGWLISIDSVCRIVQQCLNSGFHFVSTRKLNQDCLEVSIRCCVGVPCLP